MLRRVRAKYSGVVGERFGPTLACEHLEPGAQSARASQAPGSSRALRSKRRERVGSRAYIDGGVPVLAKAPAAGLIEALNYIGDTTLFAGTVLPAAGSLTRTA